MSQDAQGHTRTTEDRTFSTRAAQTLAVPDAYDTIAVALQIAGYCDVVAVAPGTYVENGLNVPKGVTLQGAGWEQTTLAGDGTSSVLTLQPGSSVAGLTIQGSGPDYFHAGVWVSDGPVTLRANRITGNATGVWAWCFDAATCALQVTLENNLIHGNTRDGLDSNGDAVFILRNNTLVGNGGRGVALNNASALAENNIVANNGATGIANEAGATVQYNLAWNNATDYNGDTGAGNLTADPFFRDVTGGDYRVHAGSPAVGHGTPAGVDMGALPFVPVGVTPINVQIRPAGTDTWRVSWTGNGAAGYYLYLGDTSGLYTQYFDAGNTTTYDLHGLTLGAVYYLTISSYDAAGDESAVAPEVAYTASIAAPPEALSIQGPSTGLSGNAYTFQATVSPATSSMPITFTWQTAEQLVSHTGGLTDTAMLTWQQSGMQTITVTATNADGSVQQTQAFQVITPLTAVQIAGPEQGTVGTPVVLTATVTPVAAGAPITYVWQTAREKVTQVSGPQAVAALTWLLPGPQTVTVTAHNFGGSVVATHTLTLNLAAETRVTIYGPGQGNIGQPLVFTATTTLGTALLPNTYIWETTEHAPVTHTAAVRDTLTLAWPTAGRKLITVTVQRQDATLVLYDQATYVVLIADAQRVYLPLVLR